MPELELVSSCSVSFSARGRSRSPLQLEALPSEDSRTPGHTTQEEKAEAPSSSTIAPVLHLPAATLPPLIHPQSFLYQQYGIDSDEQEDEHQPCSAT